jgi:Glycosyl transferases group 1
VLKDPARNADGYGYGVMGGYKETVFVNARFLTQTTTGVQRYGIEVCRRLKQLDSPFTFRFLTPKNVIQPQIADELGAEIVGKFRGHLWEQLDLPRFTMGSPLLNLGNTGPVSRRKQIVIMYDASTRAMPASYTPSFRMTYRILSPILGRQSQRIITVSEFSRAELIKYNIADSAKIVVIPGAASHLDGLVEDKSILESSGLVGAKFVLAVSSANPSKNFQAFSKAVSLPNQDPYIAVTVGGSDARVFTTDSNPNNLMHLGYVTDEQLKALYKAAALFVIPSLYEGFGLTPLEAMQMGCPTLVSNAASIPEICKDGSEYFDPLDIQSLADNIKRILSDSSLQDDLRIRAKARAASFTWQNTSLAIHGLLTELFAT